MNYSVLYMPHVTAAIDQQAQYLCDQHASPDRVATWLEELYDLVDSLEQWPRRYPVDDVATAALETEVRRVSFGNYIIYFRVDDSQMCVSVLHFRHAAQETNQPTADDL